MKLVLTIEGDSDAGYQLHVLEQRVVPGADAHGCARLLKVIERALHAENMDAGGTN